MLRSSRLRTTVAILVCLMLVDATRADAQIRVTFDVTVDRYYDYVTGSYIPIPAFTGTGWFEFPDVPPVATDYGTTTITQFGGPLATTWYSPITGLLPQDPYAGYYGSFYNAYTFPNVSDYPSTFIEEAAAQANTYVQIDGGFRAYHVELRADRRSAARAGDGSSDYGFTRDSFLAFPEDQRVSAAPAYFAESVEEYDRASGTYLGGVAYEGRAIITGIDVRAVVTPEPAAGALFGAGILGISLVGIRQRTARIS